MRKGILSVLLLIASGVAIFSLPSCEKEDATNSNQDKNLTCGTSLLVGYHCISNAGASVLTTYEIPEIIGYWDESVNDFCINYRSDGTGTITFKPSGFSQGSTQEILWGAMVDSEGELQLSNSGTIYICHESLDGSLDPQIAILSFKQSTKQWYGYDLEKVSSCGTVNPGPGTGGNGELMFWTSEDLNCGPVTVNVSGQTGVITQYYSSGAPQCGASGCANFELPAGNYTFTASCDNVTWGPSQVTVTDGGCFKMQLTN